MLWLVLIWCSYKFSQGYERYGSSPREWSFNKDMRGMGQVHVNDPLIGRQND